MQKIERLSLEDATVQKLADLTQRVRTASNPGSEARDQWVKLDRELRRKIQAVLQDMSTGLKRCMYCEDSEGTDIEHFWPKSTYPLMAFDWLNYLLACTRCNSNYKRARFPLDGQGMPLPIDPTTDDPADHLQLTPTTGIYVELDVKGENTIDICGLNRDVCVAGRTNAWTAIEVLIPAYGPELL
ncbi:hypothetical protein [Spongiactinospora sp. TRM90649]|uniref:hypothetical protein n=1 Tax=Spongiactinospora sp. TRM90649 TaxID=3031114 RepID=UPI0023F8D8BB|nr:hypothetical protein [Spongiactinospora sp. TRM90649]MDF5751420.1 hypothetical protein [Spongiactinospora sp. TRM90649]